MSGLQGGSDERLYRDDAGSLGGKYPTRQTCFERLDVPFLYKLTTANRSEILGNQSSVGWKASSVRGSNRVSCWVRLQSPASDHELSSGPRRLSTHHRHHRHRSRGRPFLHGQVLQHQGDAILLRHGPRALAKEKGGD